ncbi:MAG: hypothetical protein ABL958_00745 [Bdellovibrionia bacterium]
MKIFLFALSLLSSTFVLADSWNHKYLQATDGTKIVIDYQFNPRCHRFTSEGRSDVVLRYASPVWINVRGARPTSNVKVDIEFYSQSNRRWGSGEPALVRDTRHYDRSVKLAYSGEDRFSGQANDVAVRLSIGSSYTDLNILQKLKITIDGRKLIDPISGTDQFLVSLDNKIGCNPF